MGLILAAMLIHVIDPQEVSIQHINDVISWHKILSADDEHAGGDPRLDSNHCTEEMHAVFSDFLFSADTQILVRKRTFALTLRAAGTVG